MSHLPASGHLPGVLYIDPPAAMHLRALKLQLCGRQCSLSVALKVSSDTRRHHISYPSTDSQAAVQRHHSGMATAKEGRHQAQCCFRSTASHSLRGCKKERERVAVGMMRAKEGRNKMCRSFAAHASSSSLICMFCMVFIHTSLKWSSLAPNCLQ